MVNKSIIRNILKTMVKDLKYRNALLLSLEGEPFSNRKPKGTIEHSKIKKFSKELFLLRKKSRKKKTIKTTIKLHNQRYGHIGMISAT